MPTEELIPETRFTALGEDRIAYQVFGEGNVDLIYLSPSGDSIDSRWEWPAYASFLHHLGGLARVIMFDQRVAEARILLQGKLSPAGSDSRTRREQCSMLSVANGRSSLD